ncbi:glycerophosphodiester phosphodiesterase family protein [Altererythrobacter sp. TH136]|uniref:glycerophosphodiester phosphodiesterase family protein n=1 Tax=Altererythrobacter sp. TH136 TaxID=2067415 RepID=UPI00116463F4|nr:glycerophosphodiester phosphodiesterase family protein [Altererythrobacter sp. TH136]QDM40828.1 glycerophosphodiester phosphodiesterase [Altererythrobacter sp. TH136]
MRIFLAFAALALAMPAQAQLIIAHRGASGERPEHTLAAYERAIDAGADFIEPDLVVTKDLVLVARHENELSDTTDVGSRDEFTDRRRSKEIDGRLVNGWFAEDFTLAELRTLRARERLPDLRRANARYDGLYQVPTLAEIVALVRAKEAERGHRIGLYPELKHPTFLLTQGIDSVDLLVTALRKEGLDTADAPVFIQSFEVAPLKRLDKLTDARLVQLVSAEGGPADEAAATYADMLTATGLGEIAKYADAIGAEMRLIAGADGKPTGLVEQAHGAGLKVHAWTLRKENAFLPASLRTGSDPAVAGDYAAAWGVLAAAGVDGVFTDDPALAAPLRRSARP